MHRILKKSSLTLLSILLSGAICFGQVQLNSFVFSNGAVQSTGTNLQLNGTIGQAIVGPVQGTNINANGGFWAKTVSACDSVVTNVNDSGPGSLREALACAVTGDTITFDVDGTIVFSSEITISEGVTLDATGHDILLDGGGTNRIFIVSAGNNPVVFRHLTFQNGFGDFGGAMRVLSPAGFVNCLFQANIADNGGAIDATVNTYFQNCRFTNNQANFQSGAIQIFWGVHTFVNCQFNSNTAGSLGGTIYQGKSDASYINCTFAGNSGGFGGAIYKGDSSTISIQNSIIAMNTTTNVPGDIFAESPVDLAQNNIIGDATNSGISIGSDNNIETDPLLLDVPSGNLGLQPFSPAHGNADPSFLPPDILDANNDGDLSSPIDFDFHLATRGSTAGCNFDIGAIETAQGGLTVINSNDSGVGSLRSHMECANSNPNINQIKFAIPGDGPHLINLSSDLPFIGSNDMVIDGTSQAGASFDTPKVIIDGQGIVDHIFNIGDAQNISILGLGMRNAISRAIAVVNSQFVTISANTIFTNTGQDHIAFFSSDNCNVFSNKIGIDIDGTVSSLQRPVLWFDNCSNNRIGLNTIAGSPNSFLLGITNGSSNNEVTGNSIGSNSDGSSAFGGSIGIFLDLANDNLIYQNLIANNLLGVQVQNLSLRNSISENNFLCNANLGILLDAGVHLDILPPVISAATTKSISGIAQANSVIEVYVQDDTACPNTACQGRFAGFTQADGSGNWTFNDTTFAENTTVTAIQINNNNTSAFAICSLVQCDISADAIGGQLNCTDTTLVLQGFSNDPAATFAWTGPDGFSSSEQNPTASVPGIYTLTVSDTTGCSAMATTTVTADQTTPDIFLLGAQLDCLTPIAVLSGGSTTPGATFQWTGPNGFISDTLNPQTTVPGEYILTVTGPNGCTADGALLLVQDTTSAPVANFVVDINELHVSFTSTSSGNPFFTSWDFGNGLTAFGDTTSFNFLTGGQKEITLIVSNQCGADTISQIIELLNPQEAVGFCFPEKVEGAIGDTVKVPIKVTNFENVASLQFSIHTGDPAIATILGVSDFNLPELNTDDFNQFNDTTISVAWFFGNGVTLPDSSMIFYVDVLLTGTDAVCTPIYIDDSPVFIEVGVLRQNTVSSAPYSVTPGEVCVLPLANIFGRVYRETNQGLRGVTVSCTDQPSVVTGSDGLFSFLDLMTGLDYTIVPKRDTLPLDGVTAIDLALIQRHILNLQFLDSPYKVIAADVDHSNSVGAIDLANIQRLILGKTNVFPNGNDSWRFVDANFTFADPNNPFVPPFPEDRTIVDLRTDVTDVDFIGMKLGDVNGTALGRLVAEPLELVISETEYEGVSVLSFKAKHTERISAYQFEITFDESQMELLQIEAGELPGVTEGQFATHRLQEGIIPTLWFDPSGNPEGYQIQAGEELFKLYFQQTDALSPIAERIGAKPRYMPAMGYTPEGAEMPIKISYAVPEAEDLPEIQESIALEPLRPNPFTEAVQVRFYLPLAATVNFQVRDALGRLVKEINQQLPAGQHQLEINSTDLGSAGWYTVQMRSGQFIATRRMIYQN